MSGSEGSRMKQKENTQSRKREWGKGRERDGKGRGRKDGREKERGRGNEGPLGGTSLGLLYGVNAPLLQPFWTFLSMLTRHRLNEQIKTRQWTQCEHFPLRERDTTLTLRPQNQLVWRPTTWEEQHIQILVISLNF